MLSLSDLEPQFVRREIRPCHVGAPDCHTVSDHTEHEWHVYVDTLAEADGIAFLCPKCFADNSGSRGTHQVLCWRPRVPADVSPKPGRWEFEGTGYDDLSLRAGSSSILLNGGCNAHFWIEHGAIRMA
jgi:hypothetical protein